MKPLLGTICIIAPIVAAYWDIVAPTVKNLFTNQRHRNELLRK